MRQGSNPKRSRGGRSNGKRSHQNVRTATFESNGADNKVKGTAAQVLEKYQALARDALSSGDRIMAENYLQHAEHYYRVLNPHLANDERPAEETEGGSREHAPDRNSQPDRASQPRNGGAAPRDEQPIKEASGTDETSESEAAVAAEDSVEPSPQSA